IGLLGETPGCPHGGRAHESPATRNARFSTVHVPKILNLWRQPMNLLPRRIGLARNWRRGAWGVLAVMLAGGPVQAGLIITPTFTANFNADFGANAVAAQNAWIAAANVFETNFTDNIHINITVDAVAGTSVFGQSSFPLNSTSYANLRNLVVA